MKVRHQQQRGPALVVTLVLLFAGAAAAQQLPEAENQEQEIPEADSLSVALAPYEVVWAVALS